MKSLALVCGALLALAGCRTAGAADENAVRIRIKGSDTIGELLRNGMTKAYVAEHPGVKVEWESLGSSTAFVGLLDGSADIGAASRPVDPAELAEARQLGVPLSEHVIAYDGIAVVVHSSNPVKELSFEQLTEVFSGRTKTWKAIGGRNFSPLAVSLPSYSGTQALFRKAILHAGESGAENFTDETLFVESGEELLKLVAKDRRAIAYVGAGLVDAQHSSAVAVAIALSAQTGQPAVAPTEAAIRDGSYPLARPLFFYTRGEPSGPARDFVAFVLSAAGQKIVSDSHLVARDLAVPVLAEGAVPAVPVPEAPTHILFMHKSTQLGSADRKLLDPLAEKLLRGNQALRITGHADSVYPRDNNQRYSLDRAEAVAEYLRSKGVSSERLQVEGRAESQPLASNGSEDGRSRNRRVDLRLIPLSAIDHGAPAPVGSGAPREAPDGASQAPRAAAEPPAPR